MDLSNKVYKPVNSNLRKQLSVERIVENQNL